MPPCRAKAGTARRSKGSDAPGTEFGSGLGAGAPLHYPRPVEPTVSSRTAGLPSGAAPVSAPGARHPVALVVLGVVLYSTAPVLVRLTGTSGAILAFHRLWLGVLAFGLAAIVHVRVVKRLPSRRGLGWAALSGVAFGANQVLFNTAVKATSVVDVALVSTLSPIVVGLLAVPLFGERPGPRFRLWSAVAMAGALGVVLAGATGPKGDPVGMVLAVMAVTAFAFFFVISKLARESIDVTPFLFVAMVMGAAVVSIYVAIVGEPVLSVSRSDVVIAAVIAFGPGFVGHFVMTWPLRWLPANLPPVLRLATPFLAGCGAWLVLGEGITGAHVAGGAVTLAGVLGALLSPAGRRLADEAARTGTVDG